MMCSIGLEHALSLGTKIRYYNGLWPSKPQPNRQNIFLLFLVVFNFFEVEGGDQEGMSKKAPWKAENEGSHPGKTDLDGSATP